MARFLLIVLGFAVAMGVPFLIWGDTLEAMFSGEGARAALERHGEWAWAAGVGLLVADLLLPVPTSAVMAALGILYGPVVGGAVAAGGSVLAGATGYAVGRLLGRPAVHRLMGEDATRRGEELFARAGGWIVALSRWLPLLPEVTSCIAGVSRMRLPAFLIALACGSLPLGFAFAAFGHLGADRPGLTLALSAVIPIVLWLAADRLVLRRLRAGGRGDGAGPGGAPGP